MKIMFYFLIRKHLNLFQAGSELLGDDSSDEDNNNTVLVMVLYLCYAEVSVTRPCGDSNCSSVNPNRSDIYSDIDYTSHFVETSVRQGQR